LDPHKKSILLAEKAIAHYMSYDHSTMDNGQVKLSKELFGEAASLDPQNIRAHEGLIKSHILLREFDAAEEHLELFLALDTHSNVGKVGKVKYLESLLDWYRDGQENRRIKRLNDCIKIQIELMQAVAPG
jgi:hypothetical protein